MNLKPGTSKKAGFSLVELIIAVAIFAAVMLLVTGIVVNGLQARKGNKLDTDAQAYVYSILEQFKQHWAVKANYDAFNSTDYSTYPAKAAQLIQNVPTPFSAFLFTVECIELDGSTQTTCANPPLRRVSLSLKDASNVVRADLITEIGDPRP